MQDMGSRVSGGALISVKLDVIGTCLPGLESRDTFHLQEWVYLEHEPEKYKKLYVTFNNQTITINLQPQDVDMEGLSDIFRQWNSIIIQLQSKREPIPEDIVYFMERLLNAQVNAPRAKGPQSVSERLQNKDAKREEMELRRLLNGIKSIKTKEKYHNQMELAESILTTTVTKSKYEVKTLQLKGHTDEEYKADCEEFMKVYSANKQVICSLKISQKDLCQVTESSTLSDLQDESFPMLMSENKFDFLKSFTISGIPVFAPTRDSVTLNPWSFSIQKILKFPYTIMSVSAMETLPQNSNDKFNKEQWKKDDSDMNFNAIVPVFSPCAANDMQPIIRTRIYAMCVTFATLKNPHIIDVNIHMAALGVTWVCCLHENPTTPRPEYVCTRMESIEATAELYIDQPSYVKYAEILRKKTPEALMTQSPITSDNNKPIKCESIIKPMFILHLTQCRGQKLEISKLADVVRMILLEYIGRCLSHYKSKKGDGDTPYTDFFAETLDDQEKKKQWVKKFVADAKKEMAKCNDRFFLKCFYTLEETQKVAKVVAKEELEKQKNEMAATIPLKVNMGKIKQLRNVSLAGDVSWPTLQTFSREVGLSEDMTNDLFSEESVFVYTAHALKYRSSKDRLSKEVNDYTTFKTFVANEVQKENFRHVSKDLYTDIVSSLVNVWLKAYIDVHTEVVEPMRRQQILFLAQRHEIKVTEATFDEVYKRYRPEVGLLGNACQVKDCPFFLKPNKRYNQHASVERLSGTTPFIHALHKTTYQCRESALPTIVTEITSGRHTKHKSPITQDSVDNMCPDIKKLKNIYTEQAEADAMSE